MAQVDSQPYLIRLQELYEEHGIQVYFPKWLKDNNESGLYQKMLREKIKIANIAAQAGKAHERAAYTGIIQHVQWTQSKIDEVAEELVERYHCIPSCEWLRLNGYSKFVGHMTHGVSSESIAQLRERFGVNQNSQFISIDGVNHDSFAEACFSNFLLGRGIEIRRGDRYPAEYGLQSGYKYGKYDFHFKALIGDFQNEWIDVEIFGCPRNYEAKGKYDEVKRAKEKFNEGRKTFLAIDYSCCYQESNLELKLESFIGRIIPFKFRKPSDARLPSTSWSISDRVLQQCQEISARMPGQELPNITWMMCTGPHKGRKRDAWESSYRWSTLCKNIMLLGGMYKVRCELQQYGGRRKWSRKDLVCEIRAFYTTHEKSPSLFEQNIKMRQKQGESISESELDICKKACNLQKVCQNHGGYATIRKEAGIPDQFRWTRKDLVKQIRAFYDTHGKAPSYFRHCVKLRIENGEIISEADMSAVRTAKNLQCQSNKHGGYASIRKEAGVPK